MQRLRGNKVLLNNDWNKIIPVAFEFYTNLLFTKKSSTSDPISCEVYRYLPSRQSHQNFKDDCVDRGQGNFLLLSSFQAPYCTHIIQGTFGGEYGGLFFYDSNSGKGEIHRMTGNGKISFIKEIPDLQKGWTQIVPISYGFRTDLFFYNANGTGEICRIDENGNFKTVVFYNNLNPEWKHIVPIPFENDFRGPYLLFYKPITNASGILNGYTELYQINGLGELKFIHASDKFNPDWAKIIAIPAYIPPPIYHIRVQAIVTGEDSQGNFQTNFGQGFEKQDIVNIINGANVIFREAGIHFDFDPNSDIDEIPSSLLNHLKDPLHSSGTPLLKDESRTHWLDPVTHENLGDRHGSQGIGLYEGEIASWELGWRYRGKLVVIFNKEWSLTTGLMECVYRYKQPDIDGRSFAHEVGHYLNLSHTFSFALEKVDDIRREIKNNVKNQVDAYAKSLGYQNGDDIIKNGKIPESILKNGLSIFDSDRTEPGNWIWKEPGNKQWTELELIIDDTPADPGHEVFEKDHPTLRIEDRCTKDLEITVKFSDKQQYKYVFEVKHRMNMMSYFYEACRNLDFRFSPGQVHAMRFTLRKMKHRQLVPKHEFNWLGNR